MNVTSDGDRAGLIRGLEETRGGIESGLAVIPGESAPPTHPDALSPPPGFLTEQFDLTLIREPQGVEAYSDCILLPYPFYYY